MADMLPVSVPHEYSRGENINHLAAPNPIPDNEKFAYGTAGFRNKAEKLTFIVFRCAYLAGLRARLLNKVIGMMITASHNPACDNGVKIVDPNGDMLASDWERYATELVNSTDEQFPTAVRALEVQINVSSASEGAKVVCGIDTRESGPHLLKAAKAGAALSNVPFESFGVLTTPQLHFIVKCSNDKSFGDPTELGYYVAISDAFKDLYKMTEDPEGSAYNHHLVLDCANGVGAPKMRLLQKLLGDTLQIVYRNENGPLNHECGADFVKIGQILPANFEATDEKCASFDGDADRLVYFRPTGNGKKIDLLDGDKIAVLLTKYIKEQLSAAGLEEKLTLGIVQTAYANGNSTRYIEKLGIKPDCVPTGVKNLHHKATEYDIGVYFEANGHGTVVFSEMFDKVVRTFEAEDLAVRRLQLISRVINEVVGDALADLLAVEIVLRHFGWSVDDWQNKLYTDAPNIQIKVTVEDRSIYKTTWEETTLLEPVGLQAKIDEEVRKYNGARAFVRPSGTENIVRVYAEAQEAEDAEKLGKDIENIVRTF